MDYVIWDPTALTTLMAVVFGGGATVGFILGRNWRHLTKPASPDDFDRRIEVIEAELELAQSEISALREERDFLRRLNPEAASNTDIPSQGPAWLPRRST